MEQHQLCLTTEQQKKFSRCFPRLLHFVLCEVEKMGLSHIISWEPSGTHFKIHDEDLFTTEIVPRFFAKQTKIKSFYRQLNLWGFERVGEPGNNVWSREYLWRGLPEGIMLMKRHDQHQHSSKNANTVKQTVKQLQFKAKSRAAETTELDSMRSASEDPEIKDFAKIIRAFSARLNKISAVDNKELLKSLLREENSDDKHSLPISSISFTDDERKQQLSIQEDHEESPCCPLSSVQIVPPLPHINPTSWESLSEPISSISFTDDERKEQLSIQEDHEESPCCPLSSVQIVPPLPPINPTTWESLSDYEGCMSLLGEEDDDCQSEAKLTMCSHSCEL